MKSKPFIISTFFAVLLSSCQGKTGHGIAFMGYVFSFYFILILAVFIFFINEVQEKRKRSSLLLKDILLEIYAFIKH